MRIRVRRSLRVAWMCTLAAGLWQCQTDSEVKDKKGTLVDQEEQDDPYLWLEDVGGEKALNWVKEHNKESIDRLTAHPEYESTYNRVLEELNSTDKIPFPKMRGKYLFNFWQDAKNKRGLWRRTTIEEYRKKNPQWELLLDVDALGKKEGKSWVHKGETCLRPDYTRCLIALSDGGKDATEWREFDVNTKEFVPNGFRIPEAKNGLVWLDIDTLFVKTDFGPGSMTKSGYPRIVKLWKRGQALEQAKTVFEAELDDALYPSAVVDRDEGKDYVFFHRRPTFFTNQIFAYEGGKTIRLDVPEDIIVEGLFHGQLLLHLRTDWKDEQAKFHYRAGSLISMNYSDLLNGVKKARLVFAADKSTSIAGVSATSDVVIVNLFKNVQNELWSYDWDSQAERWAGTMLPTEKHGTISVISTNDESPDFWYNYSGFFQPSSLYFVEGDKLRRKAAPVKTAPSFFDSSKFEVVQEWATSKDGTKVPYYLLSKKGMKREGNNPTLLYGYGGFEIPLAPFYASVQARNWLDHGGVYVLANIRGGGEFGPEWHQAALKQNRMRAYEDFIAIAENVIASKVTSPKHLAIMGGSNGGLLVGATTMLRPDLFKAVVCQVPLLDMRRFHLLLAGNSWMGEYGNPDIPAEWAYIKTYSPYQNVKADVKYPHMFFVTSTKDDRVHPGHARKMAAKLMEQGSPVSYYENIEGGHAGSADSEQRAKRTALEYSFLWEQLR